MRNETEIWEGRDMKRCGVKRRRFRCDTFRRGGGDLGDLSVEERGERRVWDWEWDRLCAREKSVVF